MKTYCKIFLALPAIAMALTVSSCREEPDPGTVNPTGKESLIFTVGGIQSSDTKAASTKNRAVQTDRIALSEPGDPDQIYLIETVEDMDANYYSTETDTKGAPIYTETFVSNYKDFSTVPYAGSANTAYTPVKSYFSGHLDKNRYAFDFNDGGWPMGADGKTPSVDNFLFFMAAPATLAGTDGSIVTSDATLGYTNLKLTSVSNGANGTIAFDYATPSAGYTDPTKLMDLLFTSKSVSYSQYRSGAVVLFYHTMAGVKFKSGNAVREGTTTKDGKTVAKMTNITSIKLTNILSNGHCVVTPDQSYSDSDSNVNTNGDGVDEGDVPKSSIATVWSWPEGMEKDFETYSVAVDGLASNDGTTFPESTDFEGGNELGQLNMNSDLFDKTFMFVPQTTSTEGGEVVLTIEYTLNGKKYRKAVNFGQRTWEAGKLYTYTLSANHVGVTVNDEIDEVAKGGTGKIKTFNYIKNTGNVDEYMRVAVVGNWYDSHSYYDKGQNQVVTPWSGIDTDKTGDVVNPDEGVFQNGQFAPEPWINGGDGYWYYPYKVKPGMNVGMPLFAQFKAGTCPMELYGSDAHLEIDIIVQAIDAAWFADATKKAKMKTYGWQMDNFQDSYGN